MSVLLITGPHASGKNTVAEQLARRLPQCAVVDVDFIRRMLMRVEPDPTMSDSPEPHSDLVVRSACALARSFHESGFDVIVVDVVSDASAALYREGLSGLNHLTILMLPSEDEVASRLLSRPDYLSRGVSEWVYAQQSAFESYDEKLDNTLMSPEEAGDWLLERWTPRTK